MLGIMTILEDQYGDAIRLAIYNISPSTMETKSPRKLYPKCSKVAVKQPYFKQGAQDGALMLRVDNPNDVEILASLPGKGENSLAKDLLELSPKSPLLPTSRRNSRRLLCILIIIGQRQI
ncbi:hypothetical protein SUGI_0250620 [Cryptomeria japonica]|nr:hypothetical protein SUGI_0250620 [Cryptomeria japonica]